MAHYIDADRLKAEIERLVKTYQDSIWRTIKGETAKDFRDKLLSVIDSLQQEQPQVADASKMEQPGTPVDGEVHHVLDCHYIATDNTQLCARLREFPEGAKVDIFIIAKEEEQK